MGILRDLWDFALNVIKITSALTITFLGVAWFCVGWLSSGNFLTAAAVAVTWYAITIGGLLLYIRTEEKRKNKMLEAPEIQISSVRQQKAIDWLVEHANKPRKKKRWQ